MMSSSMKTKAKYGDKSSALRTTGTGNRRSELFRPRQSDSYPSAEADHFNNSRSFRELTKVFAENGAIKSGPSSSGSGIPQTSITQPTAKQARVHKALLARGQSDPSASAISGALLSSFPSSTGSTVRHRQYQRGDLVLVRLPDGPTVQCQVIHVHTGFPDDFSHPDQSGLPAFLNYYYTVVRADNGQEFRVEPEYMELLWSTTSVYASCCRCWRPIQRRILQTARNFLYGVYVAQFRFTWIHIVTMASLWFLVVDQIRLAFIPPVADTAFAASQWIVWMVLVTELLLEFIARPADYQQSLRNEKAYIPRTVRYMHGTQLLMEAAILALFVPEFQCIFVGNSGTTSLSTCSDTHLLQFYHGAVLTIARRSRLHILAGYAIMSLTRLRVLALVRRWKNRVTGGTARRTPMQPSASTIGTAIMTTHAQSAAIGLLSIVAGLPLLLAIQQRTLKSNGMTGLLHSWTSTSVSCEFWEVSFLSWLSAAWGDGLISVEVYPPRCSTSSVLSSLGACVTTESGLICTNEKYINATIRPGSISEFSFVSTGTLDVDGTSITTENSIIARFDESASIRTA